MLPCIGAPDAHLACQALVCCLPALGGKRRPVKIILLVVGFILVYWILKGYRRGLEREAARPSMRVSEDMVRCERCGVHLPRSESMTTRGRFYCTPEHQREDQGSQ